MIGNKVTDKQQVTGDKGQRGFTLMEVLLAVGVLTILAGTTSGALASAVRAYQEITAVQNLTDNVQFALEYMSRQMRLAKRSSGMCSPVIPAGTTFVVGASSISFIDYQNRCTVYSVVGEELRVSIGGAAALPLTSASMVRITSPSFIIRGALGTDGLQPRVAIQFRAQGVTQNVPKGPILSVQTSVSTRLLDVP